MEEFQMYLNPAHAVNSFKIRTGISNKLSNAFLSFSKRMYEEGYYFIADKYLNSENLLILNRSRGAESNFFVFIRTKKKDELEIFFSNPLFDPKVKKENLIVKRIIKENEDLENKFLFTIILIKEHSKIKPVDEYWGNLHSHIGTIHGERVWDDGITEDRNWLLQSLLWHHDFHALTSHNWPHNEERLSFLKNHCDAANITFIPGWENTTTIHDRVKSPHILVLCDSIETAMQAKYEFLSKKLEDNKGEAITPILSGVPGPIQRHLSYLKHLHNSGKAALFIAHPSSQNQGIDILDPELRKYISDAEGYDILFNFADGVEQFNFKELDSKEVSLLYIMRMIENELGIRFYKLNHMAINYYVGEIAKKYGLYVLANQDDHYQPSIESGLLSDYSFGHNKLILSIATYEYFKKQKRKFNSSEFVKAIIHKKFIFEDEKGRREEQFSLSPVVAVSIDNDNGKIELYENRKPSVLEKIRSWLASEPSYYWNIAKLQFKYWFADKNQKKEIRNELGKAKAYNLKIDDKK
jgi:hypothetical protein